MKLFRYLASQKYRMLQAFSRRMGLSCIYKTPVGIKALNALYGFPRMLPKPPFSLSPRELFLDADYLVDEYTLVGMSLPDSPHCSLMKAIMDGRPIETTDYAARFQCGTLDVRNPSYLSRPRIQRMLSLFQARLDETKNAAYPPVVVYRHKNRYCIFDGKHRAALCAAMGLDVMCVEMHHHGIEDGFAFAKYKLMQRYPTSFEKNLSFLEIEDY
jgi:hypothetical protein